MREASVEAQNFANSLNAVKLSEEEAKVKLNQYTNSQKMTELSYIAQNKSLGNVKAILNEYNSKMAETGLSQDDFRKSISQSNPVLGKYLSNIAVGEANMRGYIGSLVAAKVATIGLQIATTALNAVISMGIGIAISGIVNLISEVINHEENLIKKSEEASETIKSLYDSFKSDSKTVSDIAQKFAKLSQGVDSLTGKNISLTTDDYAEFLDLSNQLAEIFPTLNRNYDENGNAIVALSGDVDTIVGSFENLLEVQRQVANQKIAENLPDLYKGVITKSRGYNDEINDYNNRIKEVKKSYDDITSNDFPQRLQENFQGDLFVVSGAGESLEELNNKAEDYLQILDQLGLRYEYLSTEYKTDNNGLQIPIGFNYKITDFNSLSDDEIAKKKAEIQQKIQELAAVYTNEMDKFSSGIKSAENQNKENWNSLKSSISAWLSTNTSYSVMNDGLQSVVQSMVNNIDFDSLDKDNWDDVEKYIVQNIIEPINSASPEVKQAFVEMFNLDTSNLSFAEYKDKIENGVKLIADELGKEPKEILSLTGFDTILNKYEETRDKIKDKFNLSQAMVDSLSPDELANAWDYIQNYGINSWSDLQKFIESKKFSDSFSIDDIESLKEALDGLKGAYDSITGVIDDYNENGYYTLDNLKSLLELKPEYLNTLINEKGQIDLNSQAYKDYVAAKAKTLVIDQIKSLYNTILSMPAEEAQAYANAEAYNTETDSLEDLISATTSYYLVLARAKDAQNNTTAYTDGLKQSFKTVANYAAIYDSWLNSLNSSTNEFTNKTNGATSALEAQKSALESEKSALEDYKDGLEDAKDALEDYKDSLEDAQGDIQSLIDLTIDYIKQTKENEKSAIQDSIDALEDKKSALDDQKDAYSKLISKRKEEIEALYEEKKAQDELSDKQKSAAKDALSLAIARLDDSSAGKKAQKQAQDNYAASNKDLKDYLDEQAKDKRIAALEEDEKAYEEMIEQRKAAIDAQVEHLESKIDEIDAYLDNSRKLYEDACNMIDNDNGTLYSNLWNYTYTYTTKTRAEFDYLWSSAQAAIQRYKGDNDTLIGTMEILQGKIYDTDRQIENLNGQIDDCETQISNLDSAISSTSNAINSTSGAIDNVSSSLGGLSSNIERYKKALDELTKANNNGGDIPSNAKWTFDYTDKNGDIRTAWSTSKDFETAVRDIQSVIEKETGYYRPDVFGGIKKRYASGTRNSSGGVSITQEDGFEAIFGKLSSGQYTMMPQGSQVFTAAQTDNLYGFASNPQKFISDVIGKMSSFLSSSYGNFADSVRGVTNKVTKYGGDVTLSSAPVYNIYGKVDKNTLSTMDKQERQRYELFKKQFMLEMLREKNNL